MTGIYGWDIQKKQWWWHVDYMRTEVAAGNCRNRKELQAVMDSKPFVSWYKDTDFEL